jgi:hypothetical protein
MSDNAHARIGFPGITLIIGLCIFAVQQGCAALNVQPSWIAGVAWFFVAMIAILVGIWLSRGERFTLRWPGRVLFSLVAVAVVGGLAYLPIRRQYRAEHFPVGNAAKPTVLPPKARPTGQESHSAPASSAETAERMPAADVKTGQPRTAEDSPLVKATIQKRHAGIKHKPSHNEPQSPGSKGSPQGNDTAEASVGPITIQPGAAASFGQRGGITAAQVNINAPPQVLASQQTTRQTGDPEAPWITTFTIQSTGLVSAGYLRLKCTGAVIKAGIGRINPASLITGSNGPDPNDKTLAVYELGPELLSPGREIPVAVYSREPVEVLSGTIGAEEIRFHR